MLGIMEALLSFIRRQVGLRTDVASSTGSLHAKVAEGLDNQTTILAAPVIASGVIKSVQRGTLAINDGSTSEYNITISSVTMGKSIVFNGGYYNGATSTQYGVMIELTSATNVKVTKTAAWTAAVISWQVLEFY